MTYEELLNQYQRADGSYDTDAILEAYAVDASRELDAIFGVPSDEYEDEAGILLAEAHHRNGIRRLTPAAKLPVAVGVLVMLVGAITTALTPFVLSALL